MVAFCLLAFSRPANSAPFCAFPGNDGAGTPSGIINTYYPGTASVSAGASSIPVGSRSGNSTQIANGDLLLVIQMQDADINSNNTSSYGAGGSTGSGYTLLNQAGVYEYVLATGPVSGGYVPISSNLVNSYHSRAATATNGQSTYQVIRVPQYTTATVSGTVSALPWNGTVGGIVAMDVSGTLTINGTISTNGAGFRGGWGESSNTTGPDTDYRTSATILGNGMKGEGIAGTPNRMNQPSSFNNAPNQVTTGTSLGYPGGAINASKGRGAPGNAGGGGTDGNTANDENSGGGGGGNYAAGAKGGNSWSSNLPVGGEGGSAVTGLAFNRVVMGGGGGAGTTNNGTADNATYTNPAGLACTDASLTGICSSGAPGGGIILLRANSITGGGTITANGGSGYNVLNDSAGGGGAGGSVVLYTQVGGSATVSANGGDGGNAWRSHTITADRHGPGGGGSGGFVAYSPASFLVAATVTGGTSGKSCSGDAYGSGSSSGGIYTFQSPNTSGPVPGAACLPQLTVLKEISTDGGSNFTTTPAAGVNPGATLTYRITVTNSGLANANSVVIVDPIPTYTSYVANSARRATGAAVAYGSAATLTDASAADDGYDYNVTTSGVARYSVGTMAPGVGNAVQLFLRVTVN